MDKTIEPGLMYRLLVNGVKDYAIYMLDKDGVVLNWNAGAERAKGYVAAEIVGHNFDCFYSAQDRADGMPRRNLDRALSEGHYATEGWRYRKDGSAFWASIALDAIYDEAGGFVGFAKVTRDLTEQREATRRFEHQALHDSLTGVLNRAGASECLQMHLSRTGEGARIALHYIDLDRFKPVNDTFGHEAGDIVLQQVAARLVRLVETGGVVGRLGGDEFVVAQLGSPDDAAVNAMGEAILQSLSLPIQIGDKSVSIGASIGIAIAPFDGLEVATLLRGADLALYHAKKDGRGCLRFFDPAMSEQAFARSLMEVKLRTALQSMDFELHYQPVIDGRTGRPSGFEALLRWTDQSGADVPPSAFIPLAEELGLMPELGEWVLRSACFEAKRWPSGLSVAVNLSATQLRQPDLAALVSQILEASGLAPERLELEITETAVLEDRNGARETLERLRALGIGIALDDFGTGFSSLSLVRELPLTRIKIDRSFVADIDGQNRSSAVVQSVLALCKGYGLAITAEGVETEEQRAELVASGCSDLQGYLLGRPASAESWVASLQPVLQANGSPGQ